MSEKLPAPAGLGVRGRRFWRDITADIELSKPEMQLLTEVCRTLDNLDVLAEAIESGGAMVTGSQGQQVINPALTEARGQRAVLHRLLAALALPDEDSKVIPSAQSSRATRAAAVRWAGHTTDAAKRAALGNAR